MGAAADCEMIGAGFLGQPVNALTTLGFLIGGGIIVALRPERRWVGFGLIATGIGSFLFHGPMPTGNEWAHDVTLTWLLSVVAALESRWEPHTRLPALVVLGVLFALVPSVADPLAFVLTGIALLSILRRSRSPAVMAPLLLLAAVALYGRLGATGGPLCDPGSLLQPHGVWHLGSALAVVWWALTSSGVGQDPISRVGPSPETPTLT